MPEADKRHAHVPSELRMIHGTVAQGGADSRLPLGGCVLESQVARWPWM